MNGNNRRKLPASKAGGKQPIRVALVGYDNVQALDVFGPSDAFSLAGIALDQPGYEVLVVAPSLRPFQTESGISVQPHASLESAPPLDTIIVPGGRGVRLNADVTRRIAEWLKQRAAGTRRIASVCTGIYALAPSGLLDGRRVTTHWQFCADIDQRFPRLNLEPNAIYIKDGAYYTSAGVTAGIDLALAMIEEDYGSDVALKVARHLVVYLKRPGGQEQYSEPLQFQVASRDSWADLITWIRGHLHQDLSVEVLADRMHLSARHFSRRFKDAFHLTPGDFIENLRLDEARQRLSNLQTSIEGVADSVGFGSADTFRRAFERRFGIPPSVFRGRFRTTRSATRA